jgi:hypothetical protein
MGFGLVTQFIAHFDTKYDNKVRELATVSLLWKQWTETSVRFDYAGVSAFHSCVVDL